MGRHSHLNALRHANHPGLSLLGGGGGGTAGSLLSPEQNDYEEVADDDDQVSVNCQPYDSTFSPGDVSATSNSAPFIAVSPPGTYDVTNDGLQMFLQKPEGKITKQGNTNNVQGTGATINSTLLFQ